MIVAMRIGRLIKALGGPTVVAAELGMRISTVGNWTMRDAIPGEHHIAVWRLAIAKKVDWTPPTAVGLVLPPPAPPQPPANDTTKNDAAKPASKRSRASVKLAPKPKGRTRAAADDSIVLAKNAA
jgi:hypothetical protein